MFGYCWDFGVQGVECVGQVDCQCLVLDVQWQVWDWCVYVWYVGIVDCDIEWVIGVDYCVYCVLYCCVVGDIGGYELCGVVVGDDGVCYMSVVGGIYVEYVDLCVF